MGQESYLMMTSSRARFVTATMLAVLGLARLGAEEVVYFEAVPTPQGAERSYLKIDQVKGVFEMGTLFSHSFTYMKLFSGKIARVDSSVAIELGTRLFKLSELKYAEGVEGLEGKAFGEATKALENSRLTITRGRLKMEGSTGEYWTVKELRDMAALIAEGTSGKSAMKDADIQLKD